MTATELQAAIATAIKEHDAARKAAKKARKTAKTAKAAAQSTTTDQPTDVEKAATAAESTDAEKSSLEDEIAALKAQVADLRNQPARPRPALNGYADTGSRAVERGVPVHEGSAFKSLDDRVAKADEGGDIKEMRAARRERGLAKIAANNRAALESRPGAPVPLLGANEDGQRNALASLGHRTTGGRPIMHVV